MGKVELEVEEEKEKMKEKGQVRARARGRTKIRTMIGTVGGKGLIMCWVSSFLWLLIFSYVLVSCKDMDGSKGGLGRLLDHHLFANCTLRFWFVKFGAYVQVFGACGES